MKNRILCVFLVLILCFMAVFPSFAASGSGGSSHSGGVREEPVDVTDYTPLNEAWDYIADMCEGIGDFLGSLGTAASDTITNISDCAVAALSAVYGNIMTAAESFDLDAFIDYIINNENIFNQLTPKIYVNPLGGGFYVRSDDIDEFKQVLIDYLTANDYVETENGGFGLSSENLVIGSGVWLEIPANSVITTGNNTSIINGSSHTVYYTLAQYNYVDDTLATVVCSFDRLSSSELRQILVHVGTTNYYLTTNLYSFTGTSSSGYYNYSELLYDSVDEWPPVIPYSSVLAPYYFSNTIGVGGWVAVNDFFGFYEDATAAVEPSVYITNNEKNVYYSMSSLYNNWETIINNNFITYGDTYASETNINNVYNYSYYNYNNTYNYNSEIPYWLVDNSIPAYDYSNFALPDGFGVYEFDNPLNDNDTVGIDFSDGFDFDASAVYLSDVDIEDVDASFINAVFGCVPEKIMAVFTVFLSLMIAFTLLKSF